MRVVMGMWCVYVDGYKFRMLCEAVEGFLSTPLRTVLNHSETVCRFVSVDVPLDRLNDDGSRLIHFVDHRW
jgi:hypothetical protein